MAKKSVVFLVAVLLAACSQTAPTPSQRSVNEAIDALGFDALALPTTAYGPGSLVTSVRGNGLQVPLKLTYLCAPQFTNAPPPTVDAAASSEASRQFSGSFKLDVGTLGTLGLGAAINDIESISITFANVKIEQLGFDELSSVRAGLGPVCRAQVDQFSAQGIAYQTKQAMRADVTYTANIRRGASAEARGLVIAALQASFGGSVQSDSATSVHGTGLFYGLLLTKI